MHAHHILVIANRTCPCAELHDLVRSHAGPGTRVAIVAPALNGRLAHFVSDSDAAYEAAGERLASAVASLREHGVDAHARVGDANPLVAIADALADFPADEIIISSWPEGRSHWLEKNLVANARARYDVPVHHLTSEYGLVPA
jgi:phage protein D